MKAVHENLNGPFDIEEDIALYGVVTGSATLCRRTRLILHGTIAGDLKVEKGAHAILRGTVAGRIYNDGGKVELFGMADAISNSSRDAVTIIDPGAHVMGKG
ncbi:hypothetical protein [Sphingobium sp. YR768]|uniref:hypothetical protein n=1 Tax=Sphingobium sp. YR768 TaxID=1884365 RepID=UPI0008CF6A63|nr:hypothetical protein [Sphingobium sp. YR768]SES07075.1 hypothetical protein SAMN05518866_13631 [Sphingobium sp. YR768]